MKMDPKLVSTVKSDKDEKECKYISTKFKVPITLVRLACKEVGRSRAKIYDKLRSHGYTINSRTTAKKKVTN